VTQETHTFKRRRPWRVYVLDLLVVVGGVGAIILAATFRDAFKTFGAIWGPLRNVVFVGTLISLVAVPFVALLLLRLRRSRRFAEAEIAGDHLKFDLGDETVRVSASEILERTATAHGLVVRISTRGRWAHFTAPLLIPTETDEELALALRLLDGMDPVLGNVGVRFGVSHRRRALISQAYGAACVVLVGIPSVVSAVYGDFTLLHGFGYFLLIGPGASGVYVFGVEPRVGRLHVGRGGLLLAETRIAWDDLQRVSAAPPFLALEAAFGKMLLQLGDEVESASAEIESRLAVAEATHVIVSEQLPEWGQPDFRRRRLRRWSAALVLGLAAAIALALALGAS
jgi:hypothetical protein